MKNRGFRRFPKHTWEICVEGDQPPKMCAGLLLPSPGNLDIEAPGEQRQRVVVVVEAGPGLEIYRRPDGDVERLGPGVFPRTQVRLATLQDELAELLEGRGRV